MAAARSLDAPRQRRRTSTDPIGLYLEEIGRHPLLTPAGEQVLARSIAEGRAASERLEELERAGSVTPSERRRLRFSLAPPLLGFCENGILHCQLLVPQREVLTF